MNIIIIAWYELKRLAKNKTVFINLLLLPLLLIFILGSALSGSIGSEEEYVPDPVRIGILSAEEGGQLPPLFSRFLEEPEIKKVIVPAGEMSAENARSQLQSGAIDAAVAVPRDFEEHLYAGGTVSMEILVGKYRTKNLIAKSLFGSWIDELNSKQAQAIVGGPEIIAAADMDSQEGKAAAAPSYVAKGELSKQGGSYTASQYYAASMLIMFLLYAGMMVSNSLFAEKESRTLYRLQSMPVSNTAVFGGKMLGCSVVTVVQAALIIAGSHLLYGVDWGSHVWLLMIICLLLTLVSMTLAVIVSLMTSAVSTATAVIQVLIVAMTFLSGGFTPLPIDFIQKLGEFTVNHWALQGILRMMLNEEMTQIMACIGILGVISLGLSAAAVIAYRKVGYHA